MIHTTEVAVGADRSLGRMALPDHAGNLRFAADHTGLAVVGRVIDRTEALVEAHSPGCVASTESALEVGIGLAAGNLGCTGPVEDSPGRALAIRKGIDCKDRT